MFSMKPDVFNKIVVQTIREQNKTRTRKARTRKTRTRKAILVIDYILVLGPNSENLEIKVIVP